MERARTPDLRRQAAVTSLAPFRLDLRLKPVRFDLAAARWIRVELQYTAGSEFHSNIPGSKGPKYFLLWLEMAHLFVTPCVSSAGSNFFSLEISTDGLRTWSRTLLL